MHGHGLVQRQQRGPPLPGEPALTQVLACRRYQCQGCGAVLTVLPASAQPRKHFSGAAIALALALWSLCGWSAQQVREAVSDWTRTGAAARGWRSLARWDEQVQGARLFSGVALAGAASPPEAAARAAQALCGQAPVEARRLPLAHQAFAGACHVS